MDGHARDGRVGTLRGIMSHPVITIEPEDTLREAVELLAERRISGAPVLSGGRVVGLISASDILAFEASGSGVPASRAETDSQPDWGGPDLWEEGEESDSSYFLEMWDPSEAPVDVRMEATEGPEWDELSEHTVAEAMTRPILSLTADTPVEDAATFMIAHEIHRVVVTESGRMVGIVSTSDVIRTIGNARAPV